MNWDLKRYYMIFHSYSITLEETLLNNNEILCIITRIILDDNSFVQHKIIIINLFKITTTTTTDNICKFVNIIIKSNNFDINKCINITNDGILNLKGKENCEIVQLKTEIENKRINNILKFILIIHYITYRTNLLGVDFL